MEVTASNPAYVQPYYDEGAHFDYHPEIQNAVSWTQTLKNARLIAHVPLRLLMSSGRRIPVPACFRRSGMCLTRCTGTYMSDLRQADLDSRYNFKSDPRAVGAVVILSANESSYNGK